MAALCVAQDFCENDNGPKDPNVVVLMTRHNQHDQPEVILPYLTHHTVTPWVTTFAWYDKNPPVKKVIHLLRNSLEVKKYSQSTRRQRWLRRLRDHRHIAFFFYHSVFLQQDIYLFLLDITGERLAKALQPLPLQHFWHALYSPCLNKKGERPCCKEDGHNIWIASKWLNLLADEALGELYEAFVRMNMPPPLYTDASLVSSESDSEPPTKRPHRPGI